ncbi:MAG: NAD(P)/FAD-dependent oxidoreductase [Acidobacteriota bacterium]|nr:NAD(P)/FAD-dependent oxidoreductase [Acidobacteriota bacterium]
MSIEIESERRDVCEPLDVIIIGAGISGLGAACHLQRECPDKDFLILEGRDAIGGTWDLFRYPGIRSDSDLYTFGYDFKPWHGQPIATAEEILGYLNEVVEENDLERDIRFSHWVSRASWSTEEALWTVETTVDGQAQCFTGRFLFMCQGYYNYEAGFRPEFPGEDDFAGTIIHPQHWPEDLDYTAKRMVVIGSGATAATIVPAVAEQVAHVTQLQRSQTYYLSLDNSEQDPTIEELRALDIDKDWIHEVKKRQMLAFVQDIAERSMSEPEVVRQELIAAAAEALPEGYDVETHFTPSYGPWKERLCLLPDGDMFEAIQSGKASVVTDHIDRFVEDGIVLRSGEKLEADIVVTATGIELCGLGNVAFDVDGDAIDVPETWTYKGMMISDMPNLAWIFGYIRSSWTLRSDLIAHFVCRLLKHMDQEGVRQVTPRLRAQDEGMEGRAFIDPDDFAPGYIRRGAGRLPRQTGTGPWTNIQDYYQERDSIPNATFDDGALVFDNPASRRTVEAI